MTAMLVLFVGTAWHLLVVQNADTLHQAQEESLFLCNRDFLQSQLNEPGGIYSWLGRLCTQFFYHPGVGAALLIGLWLMVWATARKAFRLHPSRSALTLLPLFALLASELQTGYQIYTLRMPDYWFTPTLFCLSIMLLALCGTGLGRWGRLAWQLLCLMAGIVLTYRYIILVQMPQALQASLLLAAWATLLLPLAALLPIPVSKGCKTAEWLLLAALTLAGCICSETSQFCNRNYRAEMQMRRALMEADWDSVLQLADNDGGPMTREMWLERQVALLNLKPTAPSSIALTRLGDDLFGCEVETTRPVAAHQEEIHLIETAGPWLYFFNGRMQFAYRWAMEDMVEYGPTVSRLKLLSMYAIASGERELACKYLDILRQTTFHSTWAQQQYELLADSTSLSRHPLYRSAIALHRDMSDILDGDESMPEHYLITTSASMSKAQTPLLREACLAYALQTRNPAWFWHRLEQWTEAVAPDSAAVDALRLPRHIEEAVILYSHLSPNPSGRTFHVDPSQQQQYEAFNHEMQQMAQQGMTQSTIAHRLKHQYGRTFWWYIYFGQGQEQY